MVTISRRDLPPRHFRISALQLFHSVPPPPEDHFSRIASAYARGRIGYPTELFDFLVQLCPARDLAWDCATGSGQAVADLAARFQRVIATDISDELLGRAPSLPNVSYAIAAAEQAPVDPHAVDLVTVAQALHWFNLPAFWTELRRVLKPDGIFAFWGYTWPRATPEIDALLDELRDTLAAHWPARSAILHDDYRGIVPPFAVVPTPAFEAVVAWTREDYLAHLASWSAMRYCREHTGADPLPALDQRLSALWPRGEKIRIRWPLALRVTRA